MKSKMILICDDEDGKGIASVEFTGNRAVLQRSFVGLLIGNEKFRIFFIECLLNSIGQSGVNVTHVVEEGNTYGQSDKSDSKRN